MPSGLHEVDELSEKFVGVSMCGDRCSTTKVKSTLELSAFDSARLEFDKRTDQKKSHVENKSCHS